MLRYKVASKGEEEPIVVIDHRVQQQLTSQKPRELQRVVHFKSRRVRVGSTENLYPGLFMSLLLCFLLVVFARQFMSILFFFVPHCSTNPLRFRSRWLGRAGPSRAYASSVVQVLVCIPLRCGIQVSIVPYRL